MPEQSPNLNAYAESFVRTIKRECLSKLILFSERHVRHVIEEYVEHYNLERPHGGIDHQRPVEHDGQHSSRDGPVLCRQRLGGLLKSYYREAA
jgi:transposase InsO family protein